MSSKLKNKKFHFELLTYDDEPVKLLFTTFELLTRTSKILNYTSSY